MQALVVVLTAIAATQACSAEPPLKPLGGVFPTQASQTELIFVVGGDNRPTGQGAPPPRIIGSIFQEVVWIHPDFVLWSGDTVWGYCDTSKDLQDEYDSFTASYADAFGKAHLPVVPLFNAPGNHEVHGNSGCAAGACDGQCTVDMFHGVFGGLHGSFDVGDVHMIALSAENLDGANPEIDADQIKWLRDDLEAHKTARAIFVFLHSEFYSSPLIDPPSGQSHPAVGNRTELHELLRLYPVRAVFAGHEHLYWHEPAENHDWIHYFVAGGAGAPLYAAPDRGGFAHYLLVRVSGTGRNLKITYDVVEPGHLDVRPVVKGAQDEYLWLVNGNDTKVPLRGLTLEVPAAIGACGELVAGSDFKDREGQGIALAVSDCNPVGGNLRLTLNIVPNAAGSAAFPAGSSAKVWIRKAPPH